MYSYTSRFVSWFEQNPRSLTMCRCRILPSVCISAENPWSCEVGPPRPIAGNLFTATSSPLGMVPLYTMPAPPFPITFSSFKESKTSSHVKSRRWNAVSFHARASLARFNERALMMAATANAMEHTSNPITRRSLKDTVSGPFT
ncbi:hypothetical protein QJS04_geneDACA015931 [Acorus gramineus]|uniref:Uncharacterized protein n=1 Tax=Acorus gramineus TaxID=55184 RepID=A0AAV9BEC6_ACOGR|nr:hypothetical protein QJS04_geneDACA015931 [Acorus gramineus]